MQQGKQSKSLGVKETTESKIVLFAKCCYPFFLEETGLISI